ncbi:hypothetical protein LCGC14_1046410 [marine sediment metagenome]|uniref:Uncharacterized protein n=1 Tax=marine sediment metagenome TaxID=412755 RepID=A0A0F9MQ82_9ZZZZ
MVKIPKKIFTEIKRRDTIKCHFCGYKIIKPYPKDQLCPKCGKFLAILLDLTSEKKAKPQPKKFETKDITVSSKLKGKVRIKEKPHSISLESDKIKLKKGEYIKLLGITSTERTQLYCSNNNYIYLLELTNNLDFIATGVLGGELDKMLLISEEKNKEEKCQFYEKNGIIYLVYGKFPDKKGKWVLEQMSNNFSELARGKDVDKLDKFEKYNLEYKFKRRIQFILEQYVRLQEIFTDQEIPYVEDTIRIDYIGLSSMSIGVISLLLGEEDLNVDIPGEFENPEEEKEMIESMLTARIEAIAANTQGNTGATPRWIAVKLGFQKYRFLTFKKYENDYFLSMLSEGNLEKIEQVEKLLNPEISKVTNTMFSGDLKPFNKLKTSVAKYFTKRRNFPPFIFK